MLLSSSEDFNDNIQKEFEVFLSFKQILKGVDHGNYFCDTLDPRVFLHKIFLFFVFERAHYFLQKSLRDRALRHVRRRQLIVSTEEKKVV